MDSTTTTDEDLVEEREELMVFPSENYSRPVIKKSHFLKPCVSSIEGTLRPAPSPHSKVSSLCVFFRGWKLPDKKFTFWAKKMAALHKHTWSKSGIHQAIEASTYKIIKNPSLILSLAQNWCSQTNTFVFPWGEATITLEDVYVLLGFPVSGLSVFAALEISEMEEAIEKLEKRMQESTSQVSWIFPSFVDDEIEHEAFLVLWLSKFVFPHHVGIRRQVFPIAIRLARGEKIALAPALLATLYRDLGKLRSSASTPNIYLRSSLFKLVQIWIWERFKSIRPEAQVIPIDKPRIAQWTGLKQRFDNEGQILFDDFDWRPYTNPLKNWTLPRFYVEEAKWVRINESLDGDDDEFVTLARCLRVSQLVGIGLVEAYYPNRVAMQFGLAQDLPGVVIDHSHISTEQEAWDLYIPSRFVTASVTARYRDWWTKSVQEMQEESTETSSLRRTVDHNDDEDDVSLKVVPLSQVFKKLEDKMKKSKHLTKKRRKRATEYDESAKTQDNDNITIAQIHKTRKKCGNSKLEDKMKKSKHLTKKRRKRATEYDESAKTQDNDNITIAQIHKSRKKCGNSKLVDNNVADLTRKLASGDETVATLETEQKSEEDVKKNSSVPSSGVPEKEGNDDIDYDRLKQRKLAVWEMALKMEARILKVEKTLAKIKRWKSGRIQTKISVTA